MLFHFITFQFEVGGEEHGTKTRAQGSSCRADNDLIEVGSDSGTARVISKAAGGPSLPQAPRHYESVPSHIYTTN